jgi:hypothetical protein
MGFGVLSLFAHIIILYVTLHTRHQWLAPVTPATQEAEIRRITVRSQSRLIVCETLS